MPESSILCLELKTLQILQHLRAKSKYLSYLINRCRANFPVFSVKMHENYVFSFDKL